MSENYLIEQLEQDDWQLLKAIRLEALSLEPNSFGSNYQKEAPYEEQEWRAFVGNGKDRAIFVLKGDDEVIGVTGIVRSGEQQQEAVLIASYIRREHRGKGLSRLLYEARLNWASRNNFSSVIVSHRESNIASKMANQKFDFQYTGEEDKVWIDGKNEKQIMYRLALR